MPSERFPTAHPVSDSNCSDNIGHEDPSVAFAPRAAGVFDDLGKAFPILIGTNDFQLYDTESVYASNRGHDSIAVFATEAKKGTLVPVEHVRTQGKMPRAFARWHGAR